MADHVRKQIRAAAVSTLAGLATTGANVFESRPANRPLQGNELPGLLVDLAGEDITRGSMGVRGINERTAVLRVRVVVKEVDSYADTLDQIIKEVEIALAGNQTLGGLCKYVQPVSIDVDLDGETERPVASADMNFEVLYYTALDAPDVPR